MKKLLKTLMAAAMLFALGCGQEKKEEVVETVETVEQGTGVYTLYNATGEDLKELFVYNSTSSDKGSNLADAFEDGMTVELTDAADAVLVVEFTTAGGTTKKFETLHIETAPITLLSDDAMTGATPIMFGKPQGTGVYTLFNLTGDDLTEVFVYPVGTEDKGENYAESFEDGMTVEFTGDADSVLVVEFTTANGETKKFETLHIEEAPIYLLSEDSMTGSTPISFRKPE